MPNTTCRRLLCLQLRLQIPTPFDQKRLQTLERFELLFGVEAGLKTEVTQQETSTGGKHSRPAELLRCYACRLINPAVTEILCDYIFAANIFAK